MNFKITIFLFTLMLIMMGLYVRMELQKQDAYKNGGIIVGKIFKAAHMKTVTEETTGYSSNGDLVFVPVEKQVHVPDKYFFRLRVTWRDKQGKKYSRSDVFECDKTTYNRFNKGDKYEPYK